MKFWTSDAFKKFMEIWGMLPTTQARVSTSMVCTVGTAITYHVCAFLYSTGTLARQWEPSWEWLAFLLALAGVDTVHFIGKRMTDKDYIAAKNGVTPPPATP